jgi:hypothetical protein
MSRPIPQWKLDMLKDATVAADLIVKKAEADKVAAETAARATELKSKCAAWHVWKNANEWVMQMVEITPGIKGNEREWEVPPKVGLRQVKNNEKCPYCGK